MRVNAVRSFVLSVMVLVGVASVSAQDNGRLDIVEAVNQALAASNAMVRSNADYRSASARYDLVLQDYAFDFDVTGPEVDVDIEKRFDDPNADSPYAPRALGWSVASGVDVTKQTATGGRFTAGLSHSLSVSRYGDETLSQTPTLRFSLRQPVFVDGRLFSTAFFDARVDRSTNDLERAELGTLESRNRLAVSVVNYYLGVLSAQRRLQSISESIDLLSPYQDVDDVALSIMVDERLHSARGSTPFAESQLDRELTRLESATGVSDIAVQMLVSVGNTSRLREPLEFDEADIADSPRVRRSRSMLESARLALARSYSHEWPTLDIRSSISPIYGPNREEGLDLARSITDYFAPGGGLRASASIGLRFPLHSSTKNELINSEVQADIDAAQAGFDDSVESIRAELKVAEAERKGYVDRLGKIGEEIEELRERLDDDAVASEDLRTTLLRLRVSGLARERQQVMGQLLMIRLRTVRLLGQDVLNELERIVGEAE